MFDNIWNNIFGGMSGKSDYKSYCAVQEAARKQILMTELGNDVNKLIDHFGITKDSQGQSGTTTLAEISSVVLRTRHRADAYTKVLNELYQRTGYMLVIINNRRKQ